MLYDTKILVLNSSLQIFNIKQTEMETKSYRLFECK